LTTFDIGAEGGTCAIWIIRSLDIDPHPMHIHVNSFVVLNTSANWNDNPDLDLFMQDYTKPWDSIKGVGLSGVWRDTVIIPPYGYVAIKQCYDAGVKPGPDLPVETFGGKFVFHCHFLPHEDTGLMRNIILGSKTLDEAS
jgi:FtsP/CotA-like multicopper oxidase with cupredoxin domain